MAGEHPDPDVPVVEVLHQVDEMAEIATEAIEPPDDDHVSLPRRLEEGGEPRAVLTLSGRLVLVDRVATRLVLKYNIRGGGDHHLGPQVLLAVELDALFDGDEADLTMDQRFHDLDHLPAVGDGFHGSVQ